MIDFGKMVEKLLLQPNPSRRDFKGELTKINKCSKGLDDEYS